MRERARARACESGASVFQCAGAVSLGRSCSCLVPTSFDTLPEDFLPQGVELFSRTEGVPGAAGD